ncbi:GP46-like surface antigen, putative, partial [Bodo saltans]
MIIINVWLLILQLFNDATGGASWYTQWSGSNMCVWAGVTCNGGAEVVGLNLTNNNLRGDFPAGILSNLTSLRVIVLGGNHLTGSLSAGLATLTQLQKFDVSSNSISGTLPFELGVAWPALSEFRVHNNLLSGSLPPAYSKWTSLLYFDVYFNELSGSFPDSYSNWSLLSTFYCYDNLFTGTLPASYRLWMQLLSFNVAANQLSGTLPPELASWVRLTSFEISTNNVSGTLPDSYSAWSRLGNFRVSYNSLSGPLPASYGNWSLLSYFNVANNNLSGTLSASFGRWTALQTFNLGSNRIGGTLPVEYGNWASQLKVCYVSSNLLSGSLPSTFGNWTALVNFSANGNRLSGTIPASYAQWTNLQFLFLSGNSMEGTLPLFITEFWSSIHTLDFGNNLFTGTIPASYSMLNASLVQLFLQCNRLMGTLPDTFGAMRMLYTLFFAGNRNISGTLPSAWGGSSSTLKLNALVLQNTSVSGPIPSSWSSVMQATGSVALCHTNLCGGAGGFALTLSFCVDDVAACNPINQSFIQEHMTLYSLTSLPSCSETQPPSSPPLTSTTTPPTTMLSTTMIPTKMLPTTKLPTTMIPTTMLASTNLTIISVKQTAVAIASAPAGLLTALAGSATLAVGVVRAGASMRLWSCGDGADLDVLAGGYSAAYCFVCAIAACLVLRRRRSLEIRWNEASEQLGLPGQLWVVLSSIVFPLVEFGLSLILLSRGGGSGEVLLGAASLSIGTMSVAWFFSTMTWRFRAVWRTDGPRRVRTAPATSSLLNTWITSRFIEYDSQRIGCWVDAISPRYSHQSSFVECNGAVFEEYGNRWFVLWENGLAASLSVLSAVSRLSSSACNAVQIAGAVLQMCGLPVPVAARPHLKLKALLLAVVMEACGFVGGLCLLVSATTLTDGDPWGDAASVVLQIQLFAGVALLIVSGLHTGRIRDALRRWFGLQVGPSSPPLFSQLNPQTLMHNSRGGPRRVQRNRSVVPRMSSSEDRVVRVKSCTSDEA